jgi:hypothetical protein
MTKFTNTAPGARGILMKDGQTQLVEAGATVDRDPKLIDSMHPDIVEGDGIKVHVADTPTSQIEALTARAETAEASLADATSQIEALTAKVDEQAKQIDELAKSGKAPAKA